MKPALQIDRQKAGLKIRDIYFAASCDAGPVQRVDICYFLQAQTAGEGASEFHTLLIKLQQEESVLELAIDKGYRYEIRRARSKDLLQAQISRPDDLLLERFFNYYDAFAHSRDLALSNRTKLAALQRAGALAIAWVAQGQTASAAEPVWLSAHAYVLDGERARLYHSASPVRSASLDRQLIGRANKLLHWEAMLHFKAHGYAVYDMGGLSMGPALKAIDDFKQSFGGTVTREFNCILAVSIKGHLALLALRLKDRMKSRLRGDATSMQEST